MNLESDLKLISKFLNWNCIKYFKILRKNNKLSKKLVDIAIIFTSCRDPNRFI